MEETDYYPYTDKLQIGVVDLTRIDLATPEDQEYNIDKWAKLFKAKTWDIKMVAAKNRMIDAAATTIYQLTEDERIRQQCEAREDYLRRQRGIQKMLEEQRKQLTEKDKQLTEKDQQIAKDAKQLAENAKQFVEMQKIIEELRQETKMLRADAE
ncbi:MAG: PD-(D/E)XK nuclease family transposase [Lachnospiraceae bacterium]|nr:PD-(D/E)XK nuclease family transposase [Lachnospiraceae bacterium]